MESSEPFRSQSESALASELLESSGSKGEHGRLIDEDASLSVPASTLASGSAEFERECDLE